MGNLCTNDKAIAGADDEPAPDPVTVPTFKLLLLGSGESGKSTFFKRLLIQYGRGYSPEDRQEFIESICENTIESMKVLVHQCKFVRPDEYKDSSCQMAPANDEAAEMVSNWPEDELITEELAVAIEKLWRDPGIKRTFDLRANFQIPDSASYFFDHVRELASDEYIPPLDHVLRCRDRTTGVTHETLRLRTDKINADFEVYDVGGQRSERRHWVRIFQDVKTVLFVVAISEYDQLCFEDELTNRMTDALSVFRMVTNSKHFEDTPIVLLFNKTDLFREKLEKGIPFKFEGYTGPQTYDNVLNFIQQKFEAQNESGKMIVTRFVCAISNQFDFSDVFKVVVDNAR